MQVLCGRAQDFGNIPDASKPLFLKLKKFTLMRNFVCAAWAVNR
jgi:hypothetical protein